MPRYDLMHWSQRHRDRQAAAAVPVPAPPIAPSASAARSPKTRTIRPKPPRDEHAEDLLRLCREGRLFELQAWAADGKPLTVPAAYRRTPLRVAVDTGFHSLIEFLLQHESDQAAKDAVLRDACWSNQPALMQLALDYGASSQAVSFQSIIEIWDRGVVQIFLQRGADAVTNAPFARALKSRVKAALGIYLDCQRARPELTGALQQQADMALRRACQDEDLKWVSLLMWLAADPCTKGVTTDDLDSGYEGRESDYHQSALQIACGSRKPEILRRLKPDPAIDDLRELMAATSAYATTPETVAYLVRLGAEVNDRVDGGSTVLDDNYMIVDTGDILIAHSLKATRYGPVRPPCERLRVDSLGSTCMIRPRHVSPSLLLRGRSKTRGGSYRFTERRLVPSAPRMSARHPAATSGLARHRRCVDASLHVSSP